MLKFCSDVLNEKQRKAEELSRKKRSSRNNCLPSLCVLAIIAASIVIATLCVVNPCIFISCENVTIGANETYVLSVEQRHFELFLLRHLALGLLFLLIFSISFFVFFKHFFKCFINPRILCYVTFTKILQSNEDTFQTKSNKDDNQQSSTPKKR